MRNLFLTVFIFALLIGCGNKVTGGGGEPLTISEIIDSIFIIDTFEIEIVVNDTINLFSNKECTVIQDTIFVIMPVHDTVLDIRYHDRYITVTDTLWDTLNMEIYMEWIKTIEFTPGMCSNNIDDDGDGLIDCEDMDCRGITYCDTLSVAN